MAKRTPVIVLISAIVAFVIGSIVLGVPDHEPDHTEIIIRLDSIIDRLDDIQHQINRPEPKQPMGWYGK